MDFSRTAKMDSSDSEDYDPFNKITKIQLKLLLIIGNIFSNLIFNSCQFTICIFIEINDFISIKIGTINQLILVRKKMPKRSRSRSHDYKHSHQPDQNSKLANLYIGGLSADVDEKELKRIFNKYEDVTNISVKRNQTYSFAFLEYSRISQAHRALEQAQVGINIQGKRCTVNFAKPKKIPQVNGINPAKCYNCQEQGHIQKYCPKNNKIPSKPTENNIQKPRNNDNWLEREQKNIPSNHRDSKTHRKSPVESRSRSKSNNAAKHKDQSKRSASSSKSRSPRQNNRKNSDSHRKNSFHRKQSSSSMSSRSSSGAREKRSRSRNGARKSRLLRKRSISPRRSRS